LGLQKRQTVGLGMLTGLIRTNVLSPTGRERRRNARHKRERHRTVHDVNLSLGLLQQSSQLQWAFAARDKLRTNVALVARVSKAAGSRSDCSALIAAIAQPAKTRKPRMGIRKPWKPSQVQHQQLGKESVRREMLAIRGNVPQ
jgi:hypothetical protein